MKNSQEKMSPHKLCLIRGNKTKFGGAEVYLSRLSQVLLEKNIEHKVINSPFPNFLPSWLRVILFNIYLCLTKRGKFYFSLERITCADVYRAGDGVHKVFLQIEKKSKLNPLHPIYVFLEKRCLNNAKHIIANSNAIKNEIIGTYSIDPARISVIHNGIKNKKLDYNKAFKSLSREFSIKDNQKIILYVGSGFKRKGVEEFLKIIKNIKTPDIVAFIVGKDKNLEHYQYLSKQLMVDDKVFFTGPRDDVDDFYSISHVFILPTHYEPFSNVILEAMNLENIVFTTRQNGASEILQNKFIMEHPGDLSIVDKIDSLFKDEKYLKSQMKGNRVKSEEYSIQKNLESTLDIVDRYKDLEGA